MTGGVVPQNVENFKKFTLIFPRCLASLPSFTLLHIWKNMLNFICSWVISNYVYDPFFKLLYLWAFRSIRFTALVNKFLLTRWLWLDGQRWNFQSKWVHSLSTKTSGIQKIRRINNPLDTGHFESYYDSMTKKFRKE